MTITFILDAPRYLILSIFMEMSSLLWPQLNSTARSTGVREIHQGKLWRPLHRWIFTRHHHHPTNVESVCYHSVAGRPECFTKWHSYGPLDCQSVERLVSFLLASDRQREAKSVELRFIVTTVRQHQRYTSQTQSSVHDLVFKTRLQHTRRKQVSGLSLYRIMNSTTAPKDSR